MTSEATVMAKEPGSVSPYLLRRLRSYQEALSERAKRRRQHKQPEDRTSERPGDGSNAAESPRDPGGETDRDV